MRFSVQMGESGFGSFHLICEKNLPKSKALQETPNHFAFIDLSDNHSPEVKNLKNFVLLSNYNHRRIMNFLHDTTAEKEIGPFDTKSVLLLISA